MQRLNKLNLFNSMNKLEHSDSAHLQHLTSWTFVASTTNELAIKSRFLERSGCPLDRSQNTVDLGSVSHFAKFSKKQPMAVWEMLIFLFCNVDGSEKVILNVYPGQSSSTVKQFFSADYFYSNPADTHTQTVSYYITSPITTGKGNYWNEGKVAKSIEYSIQYAHLVTIHYFNIRPLYDTYLDCWKRFLFICATFSRQTTSRSSFTLVTKP